MSDMTAVFIARADLLPPGETIQEHSKWQQDDANAVQKDRDNTDPRTGGLFKGLFNAPAHSLRPSLHIVRDQEDGVDRCPICTWELEDGACTQCGLVFDETGEVSWDNSFTGFSDMDDMSEQDVDDLDAAMGLEEAEFEGFGDPMDGWQDYLGEGGPNFVLRRFLQHNNAGPRRHMSHSEAGSRRSYSQSIVSDVYGDEMDTVEEEEEEEDSEMNDFIDDEALESSPSASGASSTPGQTPQPTAPRPRVQARTRPIVEESETSSTISSVVEEEEEENEDEEEEEEEDTGPVRRGQRPRAQNHVLNRANGSRSRFARVVAPSSSASTDASTDELDEDTQALLQEEGWMRQTDDDEMDEEDGDSDGGATTVGWEPLANSNDRSRMGGSLTPTADRPRPSAPIRPPSRVGNVRALDASRGLRRRSSVLSNAPAHYEDGEADDDDSDQDGDLDMAMHALRNRRSQQVMRGEPAFQSAPARFMPQGGNAANEADTDDNSDNSQAGLGRGAPRIQRREYNPRISRMFAAHQAALQQHQTGGNLIDIESRSITPLNRPPTSSRNRQSPAPVSFSPFLPPARLRTPQMDNSNIGLSSRVMASPNRRSAMSPALSSASVLESAFRSDRMSYTSSASNDSIILTPGTSTPNSSYSIDQTVRTHANAAMDMIDRPQSRVSARPPSAAGRRGSANFSPVYQTFPPPNMGLHAPASAAPARPANPWAAYVSRTIRARNSRLGLREQSSTATLRPTSSRANIRENAAPAPVMRTQASRIGLRPQPSVRRLSAQPSTRALRAPPSPGPSGQMAGQSMVRVPIGLTQDDVTARARELRNNREQALGLSNNVPARTNPFQSGFRRPSNAGNMPPIALAQGGSQHVRSNSNESMGSVNSAGTAHDVSTGPSLGRRRSNRNMMNAPPPGVLPPSQAFTSPVTAYTNNTYHSRQGNHIGPLAAFEPPVQNNNRTANPVATGQLI
ncbi:E3 ubiquitin ligase [Ascochyta clinopodiicola]|nr:E3 ubiquitin ligase [Ascochyta clinopodiicola]